MPPVLPPPDGLRDRFQRLPGAAQGALLGLAAVLAAAVPWALHAAGEGGGLFSNQVMTLLAQVAIFALAALGLNVVTGYTGQLNLGFTAFLAIGAYTCGILLRDGLPGDGAWWREPWPFWAAIPAAALHAGIWAVLLGLPILRLTGDYFAIVTFGFAELVVLTARNWNSVTGGTQGLKDVPFATLGPAEDPLLSFSVGVGQMGPLWALSVLLCAAGFFLTWRITHSRVGLAWRSIREDEVAAQACGVDLGMYKSLAFFWSGVLGGLAGAMLPMLYGGVYVTQFLFIFSVYILVYVVFGGMGSMTGSIAGATILMVLVELLREAIEAFNARDYGIRANPELRYMVYGLLLILMVRFRPEGIFPSRRVAGELHPDTARVLEQEQVTLYDWAHPHETRLR
ncbi:MAG: branched-chain amino acid ABC transporter permease [Candidatus Sumerlaeia bacterium]|nr:branched-chain amino acid ABC transporter permease [Candidatus Sumerlaeia bacterium]